MQHRKATALLAALCTGILLTGCGQKANLAERYPEYMKYCFGEDYQYKYTGMAEDGEHECYSLSYHDRTGSLRTVDPYYLEILPYANRNYAYTDYEETTYYDLMLSQLVEAEIYSIVKENLVSDVMKPCFPDYDKLVSLSGTDSSWVLCRVEPVIRYSKDFPEIVQAGKGWQACKAELKSIACDEKWYVQVDAVAVGDDDPAPYISQMQAAYAKYLETTGTPQNYLFRVYQKKDGEQRVLYEAGAALGETVNQMETDGKAAIRNIIDRAKEKISGNS